MKYTNNLLILLIIISTIFFSWEFLNYDDFISPEIYLINHTSAKENIEPNIISLIAVGDIMPGRTVESKILKYND